MCAHVDAGRAKEYYLIASGRLGDRGVACNVEESPHFIGRDAEEISGWSNLSDRATEKQVALRG